MDRPRSASGSSRRDGRHRNGSSSGSTSGHSRRGSTVTSRTARPKVCRSCGQHHSHHEPHLYNYKDEVDEDLMCQICLQPFVAPTDTPCGHTFCHACLNAYLRVNPMCPLDRKPVNEMTVSPSNLVLKRLLDKLLVTCPNAESCEETVQRGSLDDHLKYRCFGTMVACQYAGAGCDYRGPSKSMGKHRNECKFKREGITRLPVLEGEVSHVEIPRTSQNLGITIVGGADTPLRCVVVQEVYADGLIAQDGRLQPGDQIIEINGVDMTCASHSQVCAALRKMSSVLRLGVYRERIEKYSVKQEQPQPQPPHRHKIGKQQPSISTQGQKAEQQRPPASNEIKKFSTNNGHANSNASKNVNSNEELLTVTLERQTGRPLGLRLSGNCSEKGIFIVDIQEASTTALDGRLQKFDRILFINGQDVRHSRLALASALIQNNEKVSIIVARQINSTIIVRTYEEKDGGDIDDEEELSQQPSSLDSSISHKRSKSAPAINQKIGNNHHDRNNQDANDDGDDDYENDDSEYEGEGQRRRENKSQDDLNLYDMPEGEDYMAIYETLDRVKKQKNELKNKSHSMEALETPTHSLKSFEFPDIHELKPSDGAAAANAAKQRPSAKPLASNTNINNGDVIKDSQSKEALDRQSDARRSIHETHQQHHSSSINDVDVVDGIANGSSRAMAAFLKKALRIEGPQLQQRTVSIKKNVRESLGMRIGGGIGSNEGDTPIYIANIHPHGCIGKSKQMKKGDLLLSVDDVSLCGLTHTQAVATLKATIVRPQVILGVMDGPETSFGASNFIPSWMYWQKLPRSLQYPKTVILHRRENASWGFSIVGGADVGGGRPHEPIHVLFVVPESPASKDAKIKCGDRLLAVDGHTLESIPHSLAVSMLKQTSTRVVLEVVSWMGTEI